MTRREHRPTVGAAFCNVERFLGAQHGEDGQVVDGATGTVGEAEARYSGSLSPCPSPEKPLPLPLPRREGSDVTLWV